MLKCLHIQIVATIVRPHWDFRLKLYVTLLSCYGVELCPNLSNDSTIQIYGKKILNTLSVRNIKLCNVFALKVMCKEREVLSLTQRYIHCYGAVAIASVYVSTIHHQILVCFMQLITWSASKWLREGKDCCEWAETGLSKWRGMKKSSQNFNSCLCSQRSAA